jgi:hypothetical protein
MRIALLMAVALLMAQLSAQSHAYSHLHAAPSAHEQLDSHGRLCSECLSFAPLLAAAGTPSHPAAFGAQGVVPLPAVAVVSLIAGIPTPAFRSRAPPSSH